MDENNMPKKEGFVYMGNLFGENLWLETIDILLGQKAESYFENVQNRLKKLDRIELKEELESFHA